VSRLALEVADIFRGHGPAWRRANAGHVSLGQLKEMSAIESFHDNDRQPTRMQLPVQPQTQRRGFNADAREAIREAFKSGADRRRLRAHLDLSNRFAFAIDECRGWFLPDPRPVQRSVPLQLSFVPTTSRSLHQAPNSATVRLFRSTGLSKPD
jgi:hypothetical protein